MITSRYFQSDDEKRVAQFGYYGAVTGATLLTAAHAYGAVHRGFNAFENDFGKGFKAPKSTFARDIKSTVGPLGRFLTINQLDQEIRKDGLTGVATTAAYTVGGVVGMNVGRQLGSRAAYAVSGGSPMAAKAGGNIGYLIGMVGSTLAYEGARAIGRIGRRWSLPDLGGNFRDSVESQTMRGRALNAMRTSQFNVRSELGNEAVRYTMGFSI